MDGNLTQEELDALLNSMNTEGAGTGEEDGATNGLSPEEIDAVGEIANICSGSSTTNLSAVLNQRVSITTPNVSLESIEELIAGTAQPCVLVQINYIEGIRGSNVQILQEEDVKVITDLMMGGDGTNVTALGDELTDLHMSALCEAMNQMTGASATSLYTMLNRKVDISPPSARVVDLRDEAVRNEIFGEVNDDKYVKVTFRLEIGSLVDSSFMQIYSIDFARNLYSMIAMAADESDVARSIIGEVLNNQPFGAASVRAMVEQSASQLKTDEQAAMSSGAGTDTSDAGSGYGNSNGTVGDNTAAGMPMMTGHRDYSGMTTNAVESSDSSVVVQPVEFNVFDNNLKPIEQTENIGIIDDVSLEIAVELGKTTKSIKEILDFEEGTLIELDRLAGEMMDILVNGKVLAKGEIVVLEDKFAVQLKEINVKS
ncbi:MAG: flagellar motor switch phosphatase FliY [Lachnospiraceae bacterium]|nr:flagellar motor switch phosphatase FliY [Lachnospiraceae bacterium]